MIGLHIGRILYSVRPFFSYKQMHYFLLCLIFNINPHNRGILMCRYCILMFHVIKSTSKNFALIRTPLNIQYFYFMKNLFDNVIWYCYDKPRDVYKTVKHWFYCNWNKEHWNLLKCAFSSYGWDYSFMQQLDEAQIDKQLKWFSNHQLMVDEQYEQIMRSLKLAKYCIHLMNDDSELWHMTGEFTNKSNSLEYHYDGPAFNYKNLRRFLSYKEFENVNKLPAHDLYMRKIRNLYYELLKNYSEYWWD